jgi:hypothetical protein
LVFLPALSLPPTAFIGFHEDRLGGTSPATIDWSQIPVGIPVEKTLLRWIGFDCREFCPGNSRFFLIRFDWIITV